MPDVKLPLTVYYDASCPLCAGEMRMLKARDAHGALALTDCSAASFDEGGCAREGVTRAMMIARIHARDQDGRWLSGLDVFEVAYRAAGFRLLARLAGSRRLRPLLDRLYPWIAANRYRLSRLGLFRAFELITPAGDCVSCRAQRDKCGNDVQ